MGNVWMVRAGEGGYLVEEFARGYVGIGWDKLGDLSTLNSQKDLRPLYAQAFSTEKLTKVSGAVAMVYKFRAVIKIGDKVITYDPNLRKYLFGVAPLGLKHESRIPIGAMTPDPEYDKINRFDS